MTMHSYEIDAKRLQSIALFTGKQDVRHYLNGVCLEWTPSGRLILIATNGHCLAAIPAMEATGKAKRPRPMKDRNQVIIQSRQIDAALKAHGKSTAPLIVELHDDTPQAVSILTGDNTRFGDALIDGRFPEWRRIVPQWDSNPVPTTGALPFDGDYLKLFAKASRLLNSSKRGGCRSIVGINRGPASDGFLVGISMQPEFIGVLMPCRDNDAICDRPEWLRKPTVARAAKAA